MRHKDLRAGMVLTRKGYEHGEFYLILLSPGRTQRWNILRYWVGEWQMFRDTELTLDGLVIVSDGEHG